MSFKGEIEARCPSGCEAFAAAIWSYVRGDQDASLRDAVLAREFNLLLCPECETPFFPSEPYIYHEPAAEILAFVFPESYREREEYWRAKMREDFLALKKVLGDGVSSVEPEIFFGVEGLAALLEKEDYRGEEREVMEHYAKDLGLGLYRVSPRYAREHGIPSTLPYLAKKGGKPTRENVIEGLEKIWEANDRLTAYGDYLDALKASPAAALPPAVNP